MRGVRLLSLIALAGCDRAELPGDPFANAQCESPPDAGDATSWCRDPSWQWVGLAPEESSARAMAVWGRRADDAWFVFQHPTNLPLEGAIYHWDGAAWRREWWSTRWTATYNSDDLYGIWGSGDDDLWAVGGSGTILHSNGGGCWFHVPSPTDAKLLAVAGRNQSDVVAVGESGASVHWDGSEWSEVPTGVTADFSAIAGGGSFLWATTVDGDILRWDGAAWHTIGSNEGALSGVWAASDDDAWAVGDKVILRWDGAAWSSIPVETSGCETGGTGVWGTSASDVWIAGCAYGTGAHWDGNALNLFLDAELYGRLSDGWLSRWNYAGYLDGGVVQDVITNQDFWGIAVAGENDVWAVTAEGRIWHFDGARWKVHHRVDDSLYAIAVAGGHVWAAGRGPVRHWDGVVWTELAGSFDQVDRLWASGPDDVYAVDGHGLQHWDGAGWTLIFADYHLSAVWGSGRDDVWFVGAGADAHHYDGTSWSTVPFLPTQPAGIAPLSGSTDDLWTATPNVPKKEAQILHWDGATWSVASTIPGDIDTTSLSARAADDLWLNNFEDVRHWDGESLSCGITWHLLRAMAGAPDDLWVVGRDGAIFRRLAP